MGGLRRPGSGPVLNDPPDAAGSASGSAPLAEIAARRDQRRQAEAAIRSRRRRRILAVAVLVLLSPAIYSYAHWMLRPSSTPFFANSVEWVRADVPLGNQVVDEIEHVYYTWNAPSKGGPQLSSLPSTGQGAQGQPKTAAWPPRIRPVFHHALPGEGVWKPTGPPVRGGPPVLVTSFRPETDYPRNVAYLAWFDHTRTDSRLLPGALRAAERRSARAGDDPGEPAPAAARHFQRRLHLPRRQQRLHRQRPSQRAAGEGQRHAARLPRRPDRDRDLERRPEPGPERCLVPPEPAADRLARAPQPQLERQLAVGLHGRQRRPRLAHRRRHRPPGQPDLRGRGQHDRDVACPGPAARRGGSARCSSTSTPTGTA